MHAISCIYLIHYPDLFKPAPAKISKGTNNQHPPRGHNDAYEPKRVLLIAHKWTSPSRPTRGYRGWGGGGGGGREGDWETEWLTKLSDLIDWFAQGRLTGWLIGWLDRLTDRLAGRLANRLSGWQTGQMTCWQTDWLTSWLTDGLTRRLIE